MTERARPARSQTPRDPKWSVPKLDKKLSDFVELIDSLPADHLDGLKEIEVAKGLGMMRRGSHEYVHGVYTEGRSVRLVIGRDGIEDQTIVHEIGHHVHLARLTDAAASQWARISGNGKNARVGTYARTNATEHFAESYSGFQGGTFLKRHLRQLEPDVYRFMAKLFSRNSGGLLKPPGQFASVAQIRQRKVGK